MGCQALRKGGSPFWPREGGLPGEDYINFDQRKKREEKTKVKSRKRGLVGQNMSTEEGKIVI